jgi:hypothetical protein
MAVRSNRAIPGLCRDLSRTPASLRIHFSGVGRLKDAPRLESDILYSSRSLTADGEPFLRVWRRDFEDLDHLGIRLTYGKDGALFQVDRSGSRIRVRWTDAMPFDDLIGYLLGPVIGCVLRLRGVTCLHAGVIRVASRAIAITGPKGVGKSTVIAALADRGYPVLSDDLAPLIPRGDDFYVPPGYPRLRLWPATIDMISGLVPTALPRVSSLREKRYLDLGLEGTASRWRFHSDPCPLGAICLLSGRHEGAGLSIEALRQAESLVQLSQNTYAGYLLTSPARAREFEVLGRLVARAPVSRIECPEGLDSIPMVCDAIAHLEPQT